MMLNISDGTIDCFKTAWALFLSFAPILFATCTENPVAAAEQSPQNSQVEDAISPIDADDSAPSEPTMAASIYCITIVDNCATIAGKLNTAVSRSCCRRLIGFPSRIIARRPSRVSFTFMAQAATILSLSAKDPP